MHGYALKLEFDPLEGNELGKYLDHNMSEGGFVFVVMLISLSKCFFWKFESDLIIIKQVLTKVYVRNAPQTVNKDDDADADEDDDTRLRAENLKRSKKIRWKIL